MSSNSEKTTPAAGGSASAFERLGLASAGQRPFIWDNHACMPLRCDGAFLPQLERYRSAGVTVVSLNVGYAHMSWEEHFSLLTFMRRWIDTHLKFCQLVSNVEDIEACAREGRLAIVFDVEGMVPVQENLHLVKAFYDLGVRWMLIAYNRNNLAGGGCMDDDGGLTARGREIIDEMERVGMALCLSHAGERTVKDALAYATKPPIFSHSNPRGEYSHTRNISDDIIRTCAAKGGVVGLSGIGLFLGGRTNLVERLLEQIYYVIDLVGPEHVGLGMDYVFDTAEVEEHVRANPDNFPEGVDEGLAMVAPEAMTEIANGLARSNLSDAQIRLILGGNWMRIARQVWK